MAFQIVFGCKHGRSRPTESRGERPLQHTIKQECRAKVRFYCPVDVNGRRIKCQLTTFDEVHNHLITKAIFKQDSDKIEEEEEQTVLELAECNIKARQVQNIIRQKTGKTVTTKNIRYTISKLQGPCRDKEKLSAFLQTVEEEGGVVKTLMDAQGAVRVLTVMTAEMR
jgi:hypothetical protein